VSYLLLQLTYDVLPYWYKYKKALYEVAEYYSIPICDLSKNLDISPYADDDYTYWPNTKYKGQEGLHSPHPTQKDANLYAIVIANFIRIGFSPAI